MIGCDMSLAFAFQMPIWPFLIICIESLWILNVSLILSFPISMQYVFSGEYWMLVPSFSNLTRYVYCSEYWRLVLSFFILMQYGYLLLCVLKVHLSISNWTRYLYGCESCMLVFWILKQYNYCCEDWDWAS